MDYLQYSNLKDGWKLDDIKCFKPYYKWITFNTLTKGIDGVFMVERSLFYMVAKIEHFSVF